MKNPIFVALDVDNDNQAMELARKVSPFVGGYKVGPRLCLRYGKDLIQELAKLGEVFVDNKYYDIPNTMDSAIRASFEAGASYATVHAGAGPHALERLAGVEKELNEERPFQILAVTVLTSFSEEGQPPHWSDGSVSKHVNELAEVAIRSGLKGIVCSAHELKELRKLYPDAFLVAPGIRLSSVNDDDQKRVTTPDQALAWGANALVVGRPIVNAAEPAQAAEEFALKTKS